MLQDDVNSKMSTFGEALELQAYPDLSYDGVIKLLPASPPIVAGEQTIAIELSSNLVQKWQNLKIKADGPFHGTVNDEGSGPLIVQTSTRDATSEVDIDLEMCSQMACKGLLEVVQLQARKRGRRLAAACTKGQTQWIKPSTLLRSATKAIGTGPSEIDYGYSLTNASGVTCDVLTLAITVDTYNGYGIRLRLNGIYTPWPTWMTQEVRSATQFFFVYNPISCNDIGSWQSWMSAYPTDFCQSYAVPVDPQITLCPYRSTSSTTNHNIALTVTVGTVIATPNYTLATSQTFDFNLGYFTANLPVFTFNTQDCGESGTIVVTSSPALPSCVTFTQTQFILNGSSCLPTDAKTYSITLTYQVSVTFSGMTATNYVTTFQLILTCTVTSITLTSTNNLVVNYTIGQAASSLTLPTYSTSPACGVTPTLTVVASSEPAIVSIVGSNLQVSTTDRAHIGAHVYKVQAAISTVVDDSFTFTINVKCSITMTAPNSTLAAVNYPISGSSHTTKQIQVQFEFSPSSCVSTYTYSVASTPSATFITWDAVDTITINTTSQAHVGDYTVVVTATPQPSAFLVLSAPATTTFSLKVYEPCIITSLDPASQITSPVNRLLTSTTATIIDVPQFVVTPSACNTNVKITLLENSSPVATFDQATSIATSTDTNINFTSVSQLSFSHTANSAAASRTFVISAEVVSTQQIQGMITANPLTFTVNLICTINSITMTAPSSSYCHSALKSPYSATTLNPPTSVVDPTDCPGAIVQYSLKPMTGISLPTYLKPTAGSYEVDTQDPTLIGTQELFQWQASVSSTATLQGATVQSQPDEQIKVTIFGCQSTTLSTTYAGTSSFVYLIDPLNLTPQTFALPLYSFDQPSCGNLYSLNIVRTDAVQTIPFTWDNSQLSYSGTTYTSEVSVQNYQITAEQTDACSPQTLLTSATFQFTLTIQCKVTSITAQSPMADIVELMSSATNTQYTLPSFAITPSDCGATSSKTLVMIVNNVAQALPGFITLGVNGSIVINNSLAQQGAYNLRYIATSDSSSTVIGGMTAFVDFVVTIKCSITMTAPTSPLVPPMTYPISGSFHQIQTIAVSFQFSPAACVQSHTFSVTSSPVSTFITQTATAITIDTTSPTDINNYTVVLTAQPEPSAFLVLSALATVSYSLNVYQPCFLTSLDPASQITSPVDRLLNSSTATIIDVPQFVVLPSACNTNVKITLLENSSPVATFDQATSIATSTDTNINFTSVSQLSFSHTANSAAASRTFVISAEVVSTQQIQGMVTANPLTFTVNLICTINSITMTVAKASYCHGALEPTYSTTPLTPPTSVVDPLDCPGAVVQYSLLPTGKKGGSLPQYLLMLNDGTYVVDTKDPQFMGTDSFTWQASIATTATLTGLEVQCLPKDKLTISITGCASTILQPTTTVPNNFVYLIDPLNLTPATFALPMYSFLNTGCANTYSLDIVRTDADQTIPFTFSNNDISYSGTIDTSQASVQNYKVVATQTNACNKKTALTDSSFLFTLTIQCQVTDITAQSMADIAESLFKTTQQTYPLPSFLLTPADCGATYTLLLEQIVNEASQPAPSFIYLDNQMPQSLVIDFPTAFAGLFSLKLTATSDSSATVIGGPSAFLKFSILIDDRCESINLASVLPKPITYVMNSAQIDLGLPQYTLTPIGCIFDLTYSVELVRKIPDILMGSTSPFDQLKGVPSLLHLDSTSLTIFGEDFTESWNYYELKFVTTDTRTNLVNQDFIVQVTVVVDCITNVQFTPPAQLAQPLRYEIGQPKNTTEIEVFREQVAETAKVPNVCGPTSYRLFLTDAQGTSTKTLPEFITYAEKTRQISFFTDKNAFVGTYYLLLDVFYSLFDQAAHKKQVIAVELVQKSQNFVVNMTLANQTQPVNQTLILPEPQAKNETQASNSTETKQPAFELPFGIALQALLPPPPTPKPHQRVELRFAEVMVQSVDSSGKVTIQMGEQVNLMNEGTKIDADMLSLQFVKNSDEEVTMTSWELLSYTKTKIELQLNFSAPLNVSVGLDPDQVVLSMSRMLFLPVFEPYKLVDLLSPSPKLNFQVARNLPAQISSQSKYHKALTFQRSIRRC